MNPLSEVLVPFSWYCSLITHGIRAGVPLLVKIENSQITLRSKVSLSSEQVLLVNSDHPE